uniref:Dehydrogenase/reductase SDR family member 1 n=1 Tax=Ascaris lumbricoides TaxID=6252 RepID=A0A9J2PSH3_ASCLU
MLPTCTRAFAYSCWRSHSASPMSKFLTNTARTPVSIHMAAMSSQTDPKKPLAGQVTLVTGASRGVGKGIALQLGQAGATVYITGREPSKSFAAKESGLPTLKDTADEIKKRGGEGVMVYCDHASDDDVKKLFDKIKSERDGKLDVLVNAAFSGTATIMNGEGKKFYECDPLLWDDINNVGLRNVYICSVYAARLMVPKNRGLIVNISSAGGLQYFFNVAYGVGKTATIMNGEGKKFYECDPLLWDDINNVGLRNVYICSVYAARLMVPKNRGLIVNISSAGGLQYFFNVAYGVGKTAIDRMSADMGMDLKSHGVCVVSLWPGTVKTELSKKLVTSGKLSALTGLSQDFVERSLENGETPEFVGSAIVALASDGGVMKKTGRILLTSDLSHEYGFVDIDGKKPANMRNVNAALDYFGWSRTAKMIPNCFKVPSWALHMSSYKF